MRRPRPSYPAVFRQQMNALVRSGRTPEKLTRGLSRRPKLEMRHRGQVVATHPLLGGRHQLRILPEHGPGRSPAMRACATRRAGARPRRFRSTSRSATSPATRRPTASGCTMTSPQSLLSVEAHQSVFTWVLQQLADAGLVRGTTVGIDAQQPPRPRDRRVVGRRRRRRQTQERPQTQRSAARHAIARSESRPSKYPTSSSRK